LRTEIEYEDKFVVQRCAPGLVKDEIIRWRLAISQLG
jgi:hypothetical protein